MKKSNIPDPRKPIYQNGKYRSGWGGFITRELYEKQLKEYNAYINKRNTEYNAYINKRNTEFSNRRNQQINKEISDAVDKSGGSEKYYKDIEKSLKKQYSDVKKLHKKQNTEKNKNKSKVTPELGDFLNSLIKLSDEVSRQKIFIDDTAQKLFSNVKYYWVAKKMETLAIQFDRLDKHIANFYTLILKTKKITVRDTVRFNIYNQRFDTYNQQFEKLLRDKKLVDTKLDMSKAEARRRQSIQERWDERKKQRKLRQYKIKQDEKFRARKEKEDLREAARNLKESAREQAIIAAENAASDAKSKADSEAYGQIEDAEEQLSEQERKFKEQERAIRSRKARKAIVGAPFKIVGGAAGLLGGAVGKTASLFGFDFVEEKKALKTLFSPFAKAGSILKNSAMRGLGIDKKSFDDLEIGKKQEKKELKSVERRRDSTLKKANKVINSEPKRLSYRNFLSNAYSMKNYNYSSGPSYGGGTTSNNYSGSTRNYSNSSTSTGPVSQPISMPDLNRSDDNVELELWEENNSLLREILETLEKKSFGEKKKGIISSLLGGIGNIGSGIFGGMAGGALGGILGSLGKLMKNFLPILTRAVPVLAAIGTTVWAAKRIADAIEEIGGVKKAAGQVWDWRLRRFKEKEIEQKTFETLKEKYIAQGLPPDQASYKAQSFLEEQHNKFENGTSNKTINSSSVNSSSTNNKSNVNNKSSSTNKNTVNGATLNQDLSNQTANNSNSLAKNTTSSTIERAETKSSIEDIFMEFKKFMIDEFIPELSNAISSSLPGQSQTGGRSMPGIPFF